MRARSRAVVILGVCLVAAACEREPPSDAQPGEAVTAEAKAAEERSPTASEASPRAVTPWGIARERSREAEEATRRAQQELEALEQRRAALEREAAVLERSVEVTPSGTAEPIPMSRAEPLPAPMSRPDPTAVALAAPPLAYELRTEAPISQGPQPTLEQRSVKRNAIIDVDAWFLANGLSLPMWSVPSHLAFGGSTIGLSTDPLPAAVAHIFAGIDLATAIRGVDHTIAIYGARMRTRGNAVVVRDPYGDSLGAFELSAWPSEQELRWAQVADGVLFLCTYHMGYASTTAGKNAFLTAVSLRTGERLWQSEPLVCNSQDFLFRDGWIISGYGFTAEPDFLYVLDAKTGKVAWKKKLASGPEVILEKDDQLYVRTYDRDYTFAFR